MSLFFTTAKISPEGKLNVTDLRKIFRDTLIFFAAPILMYLAQLSGTLALNKIILFPDLVPTLLTIGALEGWAIGIVINFILKLQDGTK